ncbi:MAG: M56 family metallopeptidase, partial [Lachnospiraceae bacterium]|nr:M56 family metallopeptidase [Lachnospiraceae bacterium]
MIKIILSSSLIFLVIVIIRKIFRGKTGNVFLYSLWLLFAASLIIPIFSFAFHNIAGWNQKSMKSPVSIMNFVEVPKADTEITVDSVMKTEDSTKKETKKQTEQTDLKNKPSTVSPQSLPKARKSAGIHALIESRHLKKFLLIFWAIGALTVLLKQLFLENAFRRQLIENREECLCQGQKVYKTKGIPTPLLFRSQGLSLDIYLPEMIMANETLVKHAILHENIHKKHGDIWWGYVRNFLLAVYWFYPIVWIAAILSKKDCEYACDSSVMKGMNQKERISYGNSLLSIIQVGKSKDLFCTATAMKIKKSEMEVRIRMIKKGK